MRRATQRKRGNSYDHDNDDDNDDYDYDTITSSIFRKTSFMQSELVSQSPRQIKTTQHHYCR